MATVSGTTVFLARGVVKHSWTLTNSATVGRPVTMARFPDKTVTARGTFAGAVMVMVGSNQSATVAQASLTTQSLNDSRGAGNAISLSTRGIRQVLENPNLIYPKLTTVSAGSSVIVELVGRSGH